MLGVRVSTDGAGWLAEIEPAAFVNEGCIDWTGWCDFDVNMLGDTLSPLEGGTSSVRSMNRDLMCFSRVRSISSVSARLVVERCTRGGTGTDEEGAIAWGTGTSDTVMLMSVDDESTASFTADAKVFLSSSEDDNVGGECDRTALMLPLGALEGCSSTNGLGGMLVDDSTAAREVTAVSGGIGAVGLLDVCVSGTGLFKTFALKESVLAKNGLVLEGVYFHVTECLLVVSAVVGTGCD